MTWLLIYNNFINQFQWLYYSLPSAFVILYFREFFRFFFINKLSISHKKIKGQSPILMIDPVACLCLGFAYFSWGGSLQKKREETLVTFFSTQLSLVILFILLKSYYYLKDPVEGTYVFYFLRIMSVQIGLTFFINFIPLPPFDFSSLYLKYIFKKKKILHSLRENSNNRQSIFSFKLKSTSTLLITLPKLLFLIIALLGILRPFLLHKLPFFFYFK